MDLKPTEQMAKNAERGLKLRKEFNRGGTEVGVARATQLKNRENLSPETVKRMVSYFARHAGDNLSETDPPSAGYIAWLLWGGDAGRDWAERKAKQIDEQKENEMKAIEQKKLAIIKSNAAPEVKLKALEKLNAMLTNVSSVEERFKERLKVDPLKDPKLVGAKMVMVILLKSIGAESMTKIIMDETKVENLKKYAKDIVSKYETHPRIVTKEFAPEAKRLLKKAGVY